MTNEEHQLIADFVQRVGGAPAATGSVTGSVPATPPELPPIDHEADTAIADLFTRFPEARYRITQMAFVQEHALAEAQNAINRLQWELQNLRQQAAQAPAAAQAASAPQRSLFAGLFGGGQAPPPPPQYQPAPQYAPPPPQYAPGYQPGMFQRQGSGFLGSALSTVAGVAGGVMAGQVLMNLFSGNRGYGGGFGGGGFGGPGFMGTMPVAAADNPWGGAAQPAPGIDPYDVGGAAKDPAGWSGQDQGWQQADPGGASDPGGQQADSSSGWQDASPAPDDTGDSGWTDSGGDIQNS
jgi:hypothetical protein